EIAENEYTDSLHDRPAKDEYPDFDRLSSRSMGDGDSDAKTLAMNNTASRSASLQEQLRDQWGLADVDEELRPLGEQIISYIDDDGYLRESLATIIDRMPALTATSNGTPAAQTKPTVEQME